MPHSQTASPAPYTAQMPHAGGAVALSWMGTLAQVAQVTLWL